MAAADRRTLTLRLAYDGTGYVGWQRQARGPSIQAMVEEALSKLAGARVAVIGAGRTDAGVHALAQVASAEVSIALDPATIRRALNALLPSDIRALDVTDVPDGFNARYAARSKTYRYWIATGEVTSPFLHRYAWHIPHPLDVAAMAAAARLVEGRHDFAAFQSVGSSVKTTVRTILVSTLRRPGAPAQPDVFSVREGDADRTDLLAYEITGDGFLRHMVRAIVGTLVEIGSGRRRVEWLAETLGSRERARAGPTAPAHGLFLVGVDCGSV